MNNLYNLDYLKEISDDEMFIKEMIVAFLREAPQYFYKLKRHFINRNYKKMREVIHQFKNAISYIGNDRFMNQLITLDELVAGNSDLMEIRNCINQIDLLVHDISSKLKSDFKIRI